MLSNTQNVVDDLCTWISSYMRKAGENSRAVIGISGGKDSTVASFLCTKALGKKRVLGVLMPCGRQSDFFYAQEVVDFLGIEYKVINIENIVRLILGEVEKAAPGKKVSITSKINISPRIRMTILYAVAQSILEGALVVNTSNASEKYIGYSTKYGDSAGDFSPLGELLVEEVVEIGRTLAVPRHLLEKVPQDGLTGKTDEENIGFSYAHLDEYIKTGVLQDAEVQRKIEFLHKKNLHKQEKIPTFSIRTHF